MTKRNDKNVPNYILTLIVLVAGIALAWYLSQLFVPLSLVVLVVVIWAVWFIWKRRS